MGANHLRADGMKLNGSMVITTSTSGWGASVLEAMGREGERAIFVARSKAALGEVWAVWQHGERHIIRDFSDAGYTALRVVEKVYAEAAR